MPTLFTILGVERPLKIPLGLVGKSESHVLLSPITASLDWLPHIWSLSIYLNNGPWIQRAQLLRSNTYRLYTEISIHCSCYPEWWYIFGCNSACSNAQSNFESYWPDAEIVSVCCEFDNLKYLAENFCLSWMIDFLHHWLCWKWFHKIIDWILRPLGSLTRKLLDQLHF